MGTLSHRSIDKNSILAYNDKYNRQKSVMSENSVKISKELIDSKPISHRGEGNRGRATSLTKNNR